MAYRFRWSRLLSSSSAAGAGAAPPILWAPPVSGPTSVTLQLLSWGRGSSGQLGGGVEEIRFYPAPLASLRLSPDFRLAAASGLLPDSAAMTAASVEAGISCGLFHSSLLVDGQLWMWGKGDGGRLGFGHENSAFAPTLNPNLDGVRRVALGGLHSVALTDAGEVFTWGYGGFGALGHTVYHRELLPRLVKGPWSGKICHIATSGAHTAAISESGALYTWGRDEGEGRLGIGAGGGPGEGGSFSVPTKISALPVPVVAVACGGFFTMALTAEGQLWSWGANSNSELGRGDRTSDWRPKPVSSVQDICIIQIISGGYHSLALTDDGKVLSWGYGGQGQLGHGSTQSENIPRVIEALANEHVTYIACGGSTSAAITDKGKLYMWGNSKDCQLGVPGLSEVQPLPVEVNFLMEEDEPGPHHVLAVSLGASHAMCLVLRPKS